MNRILLLVVILLVCVNANAQDNSTAQKQKEESPKRNEAAVMPKNDVVSLQGDTYLKNVNFIMLTAPPVKKQLKDTLFLNPIDALKLRDFYKKYKATNLPVFLKQDLFVNIECKAQVGICLDVSQHSKIELKLKLKNANDKSEMVVDVDNILNALKTDKKKEYWKSRINEKEIGEAINTAGDDSSLKAEISTLKEALSAASLNYKTIREQLKKVEDRYKNTTIKDEKKLQVIRKILIHDILFINLTEHLVLFYQEKQDTSMTCCPDNYDKDIREEAVKKLCGLLSVQKGMEIGVYGPDPAVKPIFYFSSENKLMPQDQLLKRSATDSVPKIDPRKYLVIEEHKKKKNGIDTIWNNFRQERNIIDSRSDVIIRFKQDKLKDEIFFKGNISLMAQINDSDPIEIPPYSVIGENFSTVGTKSLSPYDFALSFISEMIDIYEVTESQPFKQIDTLIKTDYYNSNLLKWLNDKNRLTKFSKFIEDHLKVRLANIENKTVQQSKIRLYSEEKISIKQDYSEIYEDLKLGLNIELPIADLISDIEGKKAFLPDTQKKGLAESLITFLKSTQADRKSPDYFLSESDTIAIGSQLDVFFDAVNKKNLLRNIYKQINSRKGMSLKDFSDLITLLKDSDYNITIAHYIESDYISKLDFSIRHLKNTKDYFQRFLKTDESTLLALLTEIGKDSIFVAHALESIDDNYAKLQAIRTEFVSAKNSLNDNAEISGPLKYKLEDLASQFSSQMKRFIKTMSDLRRVEQDEFDEAKKNYLSTHSYNRITNSHEFARDWAYELSTKAARQLYKKLIIGKIDLTKRAIDDNSKLTIYVLWYDEPGKPPKKLQVASFILRKLGWNEQIVDSFLLVNQISVADSLKGNRFKGAAGVSLMWSYTVGERGDFFQRLQPSFGINVSYLDFDSTQSFEVGVGALMGLWKNKVFLGYGRNLHVKEGGNYFSLGFSFAKLAETWNSKQSSNQSGN